MAGQSLGKFSVSKKEKPNNKKKAFQIKKAVQKTLDCFCNEQRFFLYTFHLNDFFIIIYANYLQNVFTPKFMRMMLCLISNILNFVF